MRNKSAALMTFLCMTCVSSAHADMNRGLVSHIEWAQRAMNGGPKCADGDGSSSGTAHDVAALCASQICGAAEDVTSSYEMSMSLMTDPESRTKILAKGDEVIATLNSYFDSALEGQRLLIKGYKDLKTSGNLNPTPEFVRVHDLVAMLNEYPKAAFRSVADQGNQLVIDRQATEQRMGGVPPEQKRWTLDALDRFTKSQLGAELMRQQSRNPRDFLAIEYPGLSLTDALRADAAKVQKLTDDLLNGAQSSQMRAVSGAQEFFSGPTIGKAANGQEMNESEVADYMMIRFYASLYHDVLTPKEQGGQTILPDETSPESVSAFLQRVGFDGRIAQYEADLADEAKVAEIRKATYEQCFTGYYFHMATAPTQEQVTRARADAEWAKGRTKDVLASHLSEQTRRSVNGEIDRASFSMPRTQEAVHEFFLGQLRSDANRARDNNRSYEGMLRSGQHRAETLSSIHLNEENYSIDQVFSEIQSLCEEFKVSFSSDRVLTSTGAVEASWVSARMPELGKSVMIHELAHMAYDALNSEKASVESRGKFQNVRQCLMDGHPSETREWDDQFAEEDFSDLIAAKGMTHPSSNLGCNVMDQENDQYQYPELVNYSRNQRHSTDLFRAIHIYKVQKGNLPSACNQMLEGEGGKWRFDVCM